MSLEQGIQSCNELIGKIVVVMGLDMMGEEDDNENNDEGDATDGIAAAPKDVTEEGNAGKEEEDSEMLIHEQEFPKALEVILPHEELEPL
jgi:hypothetical protein